MIHKETKIFVNDNSGGKWAKLLYAYTKGKRRLGTLGNLALVSLRRIVPNNLRKLKKGDKMKALIVQIAQRYNREGGFYLKGRKNACVLSKKGEEIAPLASRIYYRVAKEVRYKGRAFIRFSMIARGVV